MGSDHRAIFMRIRLEGKRLRRWKRGTDFKAKCNKDWKPTDVRIYKELLDDRIAQLRLQMRAEDMSQAIDDKLETLEKL
eukprot:8221879-Karenia_brevis.AAC.1